MLLFLCSGVLVSSLGVYVSWYLCALCIGGLVFVSGLCVLFPVVCGVLLDVFCVYVLCSCFLCGWSCLGLRVCVWCIGCWVIWCGVSLGCSVYVSVLLIVWCVLYVWRGVSIGLLCLVFWFLVFACVVVVGFGVWACVVFVFGFWLGFVFWLVAGVLFFVGRLQACLVGGLFLLVVWVVFVCWGWVVASYFFGAILFVLIVVGLSGFLLASAFCLVLQPVF